MHICCDVISQLCLSVIAVIIIVVTIASLILRLTTQPKPVIVRKDSEKYYLDVQSGERRRFPSLVDTDVDDDVGGDQPSVYLSVIVPAFNESERLPKMLDEAIDYLESRCSRRRRRQQKSSDDGVDVDVFTYEIIVVDDGSTDQTTDVALGYVKTYGSDKIRVLTLETNRGKGGAVRLGMLSARGHQLLFADADGATYFPDYEKLESFMLANSSRESGGSNGRPVIAIGSRAHLQSDAVATRSLFRTILMYGFHLGVWLLAVRSVRDTQCGFKLFGRRIARQLFTHIHCEKWAFDVELLLLAEKLGAKIGEIAVKWTEIDGSKVVPFWSWLQMGKDVAIISLKYTIGACSLPIGDNNTINNNNEMTYSDIRFQLVFFLFFW
ncbi:dolichyl-phosphate beta-glucosyltransferase-like [Oppia nitens]|uniref:dolichyl-phosphate beta-glucosyltransferase-like n=1 Tax=Oppia nitens TaxID=1686743 RepID=UPI0023DB006B|nr:dolichyl-phosphate beta-glucosyltransferase-like [Oppia nitens]